MTENNSVINMYFTRSNCTKTTLPVLKTNLHYVHVPNVNAEWSLFVICCAFMDLLFNRFPCNSAYIAFVMEMYVRLPFIFLTVDKLWVVTLHAG